MSITVRDGIKFATTIAELSSSTYLPGSSNQFVGQNTDVIPTNFWIDAEDSEFVISFQPLDLGEIWYIPIPDNYRRMSVINGVYRTKSLDDLSDFIETFEETCADIRKQNDDAKLIFDGIVSRKVQLNGNTGSIVGPCSIPQA